jgi:lipopolysaccharide/colanic/teichoic acid biosynthesis glycosyltransferase
LSEPSWADAAAFGCWRRETLTELGLFDERLAGSSDMDLNVRLRTRGGRILLVPDIRITYYADADLRSFWKHNFSDGVWVTYPLKFGKLACSWRHWIPFVFVSSILFSILAWKYVPIAAPLLLSIILAYGLINSASTVQVCFKSGKWRYLSILPYIFLARHVAHGLGAFYGLALVLLPVRAWTGRRSATAQSGYLGKRCLDMVGALVGLVVLSPVLAILSLFVKLTSPGPIFYKAERLGRQGKLFYMLKFRTMYWTGPEIGPPMTLEHDPRVTKIGAWLRRFKLDELPQLVNVLRGEMSLVGPRPEAPFYFQFYSAQEKELILSVRPGMTDYGSLRFHHEAQLLAGDPDPVNAYVQRIRSQKVQEQIRYIREQSLRVDVAVVLRTIATILRTRLGRRLKNRSIAQHAKIL